MQAAFFLTFMTFLVGIALSVAWDHAGLPQWVGVRMKRNRRKLLHERGMKRKSRAGKSCLSY